MERDAAGATKGCSKCGRCDIPHEADFCPWCGEHIVELPQPSTQISVKQEVGRTENSRVTGVDIEHVRGDVTIESTVRQIETSIVHGDYVDRRTISNTILALGPEALDAIAERLAALQGVDKRTLRDPAAQALPEHIGRQIAEVVAAQQETAAQGVAPTPQAAYHLGLLAWSSGDYDVALGYMRQAALGDPDFSDAFEGIAAVQQIRAVHDLDAGDEVAALARLDEAREAAMRTDPLDTQSLAVRGYIAKTLAQVAQARGNQAKERAYYHEAARFFEHVVQLEPDNASAHNGLGNVAYAMGDLDRAIAACTRAVELEPTYGWAHQDLAIALEAKMWADPENAGTWCQQAFEAWHRAYYFK
jgi:tetratricopeptide (TPR) repeat protein